MTANPKWLKNLNAKELRKLLKTRVLFRIARNGDPDTLTAVLPDVDSNFGRCVCYAHIGQHGECSREWYAQTRVAKPAEYAPLLKELTQIYGQKLFPTDVSITLKVTRRTKHEDWVKRYDANGQRIIKS